MAAVVYLDVDDEITSAAARIRSADEGRVALVVPSGSRLATSRINFRLLAREATARDRRLSIVASDQATRSLAASAGLPVFTSVAGFEAGTEAPAAAAGKAEMGPAGTGVADADEGDDEGDDQPADPEATRVLALPTAIVPAKPRVVVAPRAWSIPAVNWRRLPAFERTNATIAAAVAGLALVVVAVGAWLLLPSATIVVTAREMPVGPIELTVRADPTAEAADPVAGIVPAERLTFDLAATDTFSATDRRIEQTAARGSVTFRSYNTVAANTIPRGSVVSTEGGIRFRTRAAVTLARASIVFPVTVIPSSATVAVDAVVPGLTGNVPANAITVVPPGENPDVTRVNNQQPTTGGTRTEFPRIGQADVDAAVDQLRLQLGTDFQAILADPTRTPDGLTAFLETRSIADPTPSVDPASLVGQEFETFELELTSTGTVIAIDTTPVASIAETRIQEAVAQGHRLVDSSVDIDIGEAFVVGESVSFPVTGRATQVRVLDAAALRDRVKGRPLDEARTILDEFGVVELSVWPDWVSTIPTIDARLDVRVGPSASEPAPSPTGGSAGP